MLKTRRTLAVVASLIRQTAVTLAVIFLPFVAEAQTVVVGQNDPDPNVDVRAVQEAVDQGGSVLLVGTFNFGDSGRVLLHRDVDISGEIGRRGNPVTKIHGGDWPFYSPLPTEVPTTGCPVEPREAGPKVSVQYIHFDGAKGVAVHLAYTGGASIHHNRVTGMRGRIFNIVNGFPNFRRSGVLIGPLDSRARNCFQITPQLVSGSIKVLDNFFDSTIVDPIGVEVPCNTNVERPCNTNAGAVFMAFINGADIRIENNRSVGCTRNCIVVLDAIADTTPGGRGSLVIAGNSVISDVKVGFTGPGPRAPVGIDASMFFNAVLGRDPNMQHIPTLIADNYVELNGETSVGISSAFNGAVVQGNSVVIHADPTKAALLSGGVTVATSHQVILNNRIAGKATYAIRIGGNVVMPRIHNLVQKNKMKPATFTAFSSDYLLDVEAAFNTIEGKFGTVIDNGHDNTIDIRKTESGDD